MASIFILGVVVTAPDFVFGGIILLFTATILVFIVPFEYKARMYTTFILAILPAPPHPTNIFLRMTVF